jgi:hypothetical protein
METYEQTMESVREGLALGMSMKEVIHDLEMHENTNSKALEELVNNYKYGV